MYLKTLFVLGALVVNAICMTTTSSANASMTHKHAVASRQHPHVFLPTADLSLADEGEGRPGKIPYWRFPKCYVECFDSEGIDSKTWPAIGDIRDLTTDQFCHQHWPWVGAWIKEHLQFCVGGRCNGDRAKHVEARTVFDSLCGRAGR